MQHCCIIVGLPHTQGETRGRQRHTNQRRSAFVIIIIKWLINLIWNLRARSYRHVDLRRGYSIQHCVLFYCIHEKMQIGFEVLKSHGEMVSFQPFSGGRKWTWATTRRHERGTVDSIPWGQWHGMNDSRGVHPPETMMHFPLFQIPPYFRQIFGLCEFFYNFTFSRKISSLPSAKISDDFFF